MDTPFENTPLFYQQDLVQFEKVRKFLAFFPAGCGYVQWVMFAKQKKHVLCHKNYAKYNASFFFPGVYSYQNFPKFERTGYHWRIAF